MAKRVFATMGLTFAQNALGSLAAASSYMGIRVPSGGGAAQLVDVLEVLISGVSSASTVGGFFLVRTSTLSTAPSALANPNSDGALYTGASALVAANVIQTFITVATTQPTLSSAATDAKLNLGLNTFGGIIRWNAAPTQQWQLQGNTASGAESVLANITAAGGGATAPSSAHIIYEPY